jgi:hypothetical protein
MVFTRRIFCRYRATSMFTVDKTILDTR